MMCDLLDLRPISHITQKPLSVLHSTKIEQSTKTIVIFKTGAIFLCCIRRDLTPSCNWITAKYSHPGAHTFCRASPSYTRPMSRAFSRIGLFLIQIHLKHFFPRRKRPNYCLKNSKNGKNTGSWMTSAI